MSNVMENRKRWVEALRSGRYTEHRGGWAPGVPNCSCVEAIAHRAKTKSGPACCLMVAYCEGLGTPERYATMWAFRDALSIVPGRYVHAMDNGATFEEIARMVEAEPEVST